MKAQSAFHFKLLLDIFEIVGKKWTQFGLNEVKWLFLICGDSIVVILKVIICYRYP